MRKQRNWFADETEEDSNDISEDEWEEVNREEKNKMKMKRAQNKRKIIQKEEH